jgi:hypothetical protein
MEVSTLKVFKRFLLHILVVPMTGNMTDLAGSVGSSVAVAGDGVGDVIVILIVDGRHDIIYKFEGGVISIEFVPNGVIGRLGMRNVVSRMFGDDFFVWVAGIRGLTLIMQPVMVNPP